QDGDVAEAGSLFGNGSSEAVVEGLCLAEEAGVTCRGYAGDLVGEGVFALDLCADAERPAGAHNAGRQTKLDTGAEIKVALNHLRFCAGKGEKEHDRGEEILFHTYIGLMQN